GLFSFQSKLSKLPSTRERIVIAELIPIIAFQLVDLSGLIATRMKNDVPAIGVIGGSGLYQMEDLQEMTEHEVETPFGPPSDTLFGGKLSGRQVYFLSRHGRGHRLLPHELNHRASVDALRPLNVRGVI